MENKLYRDSLCYFHEQARNPNQYQEFLCVTTVDKIGKILDLYDELWKTLNTMEVLTESVIDGPTSESTIIEELETWIQMRCSRISKQAKSSGMYISTTRQMSTNL